MSDRRVRARQPGAAVVACVLACGTASPGLAAARPSALALSDRDLYEDAQAARKRLGSSRARLDDRAAWESVIQRYRLAARRSAAA